MPHPSNTVPEEDQVEEFCLSVCGETMCGDESDLAGQSVRLVSQSVNLSIRVGRSINLFTGLGCVGYEGCIHVVATGITLVY